MRHGFWTVATVLVASQLCLLQRCKAAVTACDHSPRVIGAFGAEDHAVPPVSLAADIRSQLPELHNVRRVFDTHLSPTGEQVVISDNRADDSDPNPNVAIVVHGRVVKLFEGRELDPQAGGFERYLSSCEVDLTRTQKALAVAFSSGFDGASSAFTIIRWQAGDYRVVFNHAADEGRMEFGTLKFELWHSVVDKVKNPDSDDFECVWCPHHYVVTEYLWRHNRYIKAGSVRMRRAYDPAEISGNPLLVTTRLGKENASESRRAGKSH
jgi:hypothetical protein